ncbi:hypothetical protein [Streptomyces sp. NPDC001652]|uniref:hypothetical protein n=1 Tax=Streptomyces sp. NPDC001652 TaxID=3154393 RepID=UPI0033349AE7
MGTTLALAPYPHADAVKEAYVRHVARLGPSAERFFIAGMPARSLGSETQRDSVGPPSGGRLVWLARIAAYLEPKGLKLKVPELGGLGTGTP